MKIVVLHDDVAGSANPDDLDVFDQVRAVEATLEARGDEVARLPLALDLGRARAALERSRPDLVFNLVESVAGFGRLIHLAPALLDALGISYTGSPTAAILLSSDKRLAKRMLAEVGLPTPSWLEGGRVSSREAGRYVVKSAWEDASIGLDDGSVVELQPDDDLDALLAARAPRLGGAAFAESYVEGREIQVALLAAPGGVEVLPPCETLFSDWWPEKPRIVGYAAKWRPDSFEYRHTPRRLLFPPEDRKLLGALGELAQRCWELFGLAGYARVDFRVDAEGRPWILEVNPNPCLTDETGLAGAAEAAGISPAEVIERIVADALGAP